ncbi:hypothetical protein ACF0H5_019391 [Mactra antiquata]
MVINVVTVGSQENATFVCTLPSATTLTRWTYLSGSTGTSLMSFQNGACTVSPSDSFLSDSIKYSYTCNSTVYQVTINPYEGGPTWNNHILACRDAIQPNGSGSTWMIKVIAAAIDKNYVVVCSQLITNKYLAKSTRADGNRHMEYQ